MKIDLTSLEKYQRGECTPEELDALRQYFLLEDLEELHDLLAKDWDAARQEAQPTDEALKADIWNQIQQRGFEQKRGKVVSLSEAARKPTWKWGVAIAASIAGLVLLGTWLLRAPSTVNGLVEKQNTSKEVKQIALADGSVVWLNRNSKIWYEQPFNDTVRKIVLEGEAFFEVAKNPQKPFIVITENVQTQVLGTSFNVQAFPTQATIEIALIEGKVNVGILADAVIQQSEMLAPGELLAYHKVDKTHTKIPFDDDAPYAWRDGFIYFYRADVQEVAQTLQDWYGVTITVEDDSRIQGTLVHKFNAKELTLEQALKGISLVSNYRFEPTANGAYKIKPKQ